MAHSFLGIFKSVGKCVNSRVTPNGTYRECRCTIYEPSDNLEFLEFKYDEKKKGKRK
jgi:hypothetical protein